MELIDNKAKLLGDDLKKEIGKGAKIKMVASCFSIYAFEALKEELSSVTELQFIFSDAYFRSERDHGKNKKRSARILYTQSAP